MILLLLIGVMVLLPPVFLVISISNLAMYFSARRQLKRNPRSISRRVLHARRVRAIDFAVVGLALILMYAGAAVLWYRNLMAFM